MGIIFLIWKCRIPHIVLPNKVECVIDIDVLSPPSQTLMFLQRKCRGDDKIDRDILFIFMELDIEILVEE